MTTANWTPVCALEDIAPNTGVCALVNDKQVAIFRLAHDNSLHAIGNYDPASNANVLSRGLVADLKGVWSVASPIYKQHFVLETGACLEDNTLSVPIYQVRLHEGKVEVAA